MVNTTSYGVMMLVNNKATAMRRSQYLMYSFAAGVVSECGREDQHARWAAHGLSSGLSALSVVSLKLFPKSRQQGVLGAGLRTAITIRPVSLLHAAPATLAFLSFSLYSVLFKGGFRRSSEFRHPPTRLHNLVGESLCGVHRLSTDTPRSRRASTNHARGQGQPIQPSSAHAPPDQHA